MKQKPRQYLVFETSNRNICIELAENGQISLETDPDRLKDRCSNGIVLRSANCRRRQLTVNDMKRFVSKLDRNHAKFAHTLFDFLSGEAPSENVDVEREESDKKKIVPSDRKNVTINSNPKASQAPCLDYCVPFGDDAQILERFHEDGYVVVKDVFSDALITNAVNELWESPRLLGRDSAIKRGSRNTWSSKYWPQQDGGKNFLQSLDPWQDEACWEFAQHPNVAHVMKLLWRHQKVEQLLLRGPPRWGVMRPSSRNPEWRTSESWLHWDQNPWSRPGFGRVQAFACLSDQTPTSGGLLCVPGFHKRWRQWGRDHPEGTVYVDGKCITQDYGDGQPFPVPTDDPVHGEVVRILAPRGSLVLWDSRLPHQNFPNTGEEFRFVMYLEFDPATDILMDAKKEALYKRLVVMRALDNMMFWPQRLSALGKMITGSPDAEAIAMADRQLADEPRLASSIRMAVEAGEEELKGDLKASVEKFRMSEKIFPDIGKWHDAIFA
jgi:ectoine hydroxylase-related dioxygenase (phytanoyl-CoA dioxygenase family)